MDNAPYHNSVIEKVPTKLSRKNVMQDWLSAHFIDWDSRDLKKDLFEKMKKAQPIKKFVTNEIARRHGHAVLRSPVALRT